MRLLACCSSPVRFSRLEPAFCSASSGVRSRCPLEVCSGRPPRFSSDERCSAGGSKRIASYPRFQAIDRAVGEQGFKIVLLTRLSPIFPFNLLNYAFGLTKVRLWQYVLASWIGMLPGTIMYVYLGSAPEEPGRCGGRPPRGRNASDRFLCGGSRDDHRCHGRHHPCRCAGAQRGRGRASRATKDGTRAPTSLNNKAIGAQ